MGTSRSQVHSLVRGLKKEAKERRANPREVYGYSNYGYDVGEWPILNRVTGGIHKNKMQLLFARPKQGKSMLLAGWLPLIAAQCPPGQKVRVISLEMTAQAYIRRMAAIMARLENPQRVQQGLWLGEEGEKQYLAYQAALDVIAELPFEFRDEPSDLDQIEEFIANPNESTYYWVLDHVGLVSMPVSRNGVSDHVGTSKGLMRLCHDYATGMMVGHANRSGVNGVPTIQTIAGTDQYSKDGDEFFAVWRLADQPGPDEDDDGEGLQQQGQPAILRITMRDGPGGDVMLWWSTKGAHFVEVPEDIADEVHERVLKAERAKEKR